jgi:deazaflavin-dependent oxidoreductase (nitroreductase family)
MTVDALFSKLNPLIAAVLRSPLHGLLSWGLMLLTVTGRRSGRRYSIPVGYQRDGDTLTVLVSEAPSKQWWRNYSEPGSVELRLRGRAHSGKARVVRPGTPEFRRHAARTLERIPQMGRVFGIEYDARTGVTEAQFEALGRNIAMVQIALDP